MAFFTGAVTKEGATKKNYIVSGSDDMSIAIWDFEEQKLISRIDISRPVSSVAIGTVARRGGGSKTYIVSGSSADGSLMVRDVEENKMVFLVVKAHSSAVKSVAIMTMIGAGGENDNKAYIVSASADKSIAIWDVEKEELVHRFENAHSSEVNSVVAVTMTVAGDTKNYIVSGSSDKSIAIWDIEEKKLAHRFENAHLSEVYSVAALTLTVAGGDNNNCLISGSNDKSIAIWDMEAKRCVHRFDNAHSSAIHSVAGLTLTGGDSKDKKNYIASGSRDKSIAIWDMEEKKLLHRFENAHFSDVCSVTMVSLPSEGGKRDQNTYLMSASADKSIAIWNLSHKKVSHRFEDISMIEDRPRHGGNIRRKYPFKADELLSLATMAVRDKNPYILTGTQGGYVNFWNIENKKLVHRIQNNSPVYSIVVFTGTVAGGDNKNYFIAGSDTSIAIWDIETMSCVHHFWGAHLSAVRSMAIMIMTVAGDNKKNYIVSGSEDKSIAIWDIEEKKPVHRFENAHSSEINSVVAVTMTVAGGGNKKKNYIISGSSDKSIAVWDIKEKKLIHRFENAHSSSINSVAIIIGTVTKRRGGDSKSYLISGDSDSSIAIWDVEEKKLVHRFEKAHSDAVKSVAIITMTGGESNDQKNYIVSGSKDKSIAIWDVEEKKLVHRFENAHSSEVYAVAVFGGRDTRTFIVVSSSKDQSTALWDIQGPLQNQSFIPHLISNEKTYSDGLDNLSHSPPKFQDLSFLSKITLLSLRWNFLNFVIFLLPNVNPQDYLNFAIDNKISLSLDAYGKSQLQYLLDYQGERTPAVYQFFSIFFKEMPKFMNFDSLVREELFSSLAQLTSRIYKTQSSVSLLGYLKCFVRPAETVFDPDDFARLPNQGELKNGQDQAFIKLKRIAVPSSKEYSDTIETATNDAENNAPTLQYDLVLIPLDYYGNSPDTFNILNVFETFEVEDGVFYEDPTVNYLIDFLWEKFKGYLYFQVLFFATNAIVYTLFVLYYQDEQVSSSLLGIVIIMNCGALTLEWFGASAGLASFLKDPWNYFETITPIFQIISAILYWTVQGSLAESIFISTSILLLYTKLLISSRVFDQLRHMIRMILEILSDSKGFMVIIFTYALGMTITVFHNRELQQDSDGSGLYTFPEVLMEMYAFAIGSWSYTEYAGINIPFFIFASFLLPLVLLNMLIALMGDTYGRVQDNHQAFDRRERVLMLYELVSAAHQFRCLMNWIRGRRQHSQEGNESFYLLVVKEFSIAEAQIDLKNIHDGQKAMKNEMEDRINKLNDKIDDKISALKSDLSVKLDSKIGSLNTKIDDKIGSLNTKIDDKIGSLTAKIDDKIGSLTAKIDDKIGSLDKKIEHTNKMVSELLIALGKKPVDEKDDSK